jgi:hypothetical protein
MQNGKLLVLGVGVVVSVWLIGCTNRDPVVAQIGKDRKITLENLRTDFKRDPSYPKDRKATLDDYKSHLNKMIDHDIKISAAYRLGLQKDTLVQSMISSQKQHYILQKFHQKVIIEKVVKEKDVRSFYSKTDRDVLIRTIFLKCPPQTLPEKEDSIKTKAMSIYKRIQNGESYSELARQYSEDEKTAINGGLVGIMKYNRSDDPAQNMAFSMKTGEISKPVKSKLGYNIIKVEEIRPKEREPYQKVSDQIRSLLINERRAVISNQTRAYEEQLKKNYQFTVNEKSIDTLVTFFKEKRSYYKKEILDSLKQLPKDLTNMGMVKFKKREFTISDLFQRIKDNNMNMGIRMNDKNFVKSAVERWAMIDLLMNAAVDDGIERDAKVKASILEATENAMVAVLNKKVIYSDVKIKPEDIKRYYEIHKDSLFSTKEKVRIQEVLVDNLQLAKKIYTMALQKKTLGRYPAQYTIRPGLKEKNGLLEPYTKGQGGRIGEIAFKLRVGEITGPIPMENKTYSVIQLKAKIPKKIIPLVEVENNIKQNLTRSQEKEKDTIWIEGKKKEIGFKINEKVLENVLNAK